MIGVVGEVTLSRRYYACRGCRKKQVPWDAWAGLHGHLTPQAYRLAVLAGSSWSFDVASERLGQFCGIRLSDQTIRRVSNEAGQRAQAWLKKSEKALEKLRETPGNGEFYTDGTCINTREGWREMRLSIFAKREAGPAASPQEWAKRYLPRPGARLALGGLLTSEELGLQWKSVAGRLGWGKGRGISALGDGAKWIWKQVTEHLPESECVVDVYHVSEHLHDCGRALHGEQSGAGRTWAEHRLDLLIANGPMQLLTQLEQDGKSSPTQAIEGLIAYLKPNIDGLWYRDRLRRGLPIGTGMVEGACKNVVGRRMKCNSARWLPERAGHMVALCCLHYSDQWERFWANRAA